MMLACILHKKDRILTVSVISVICRNNDRCTVIQAKLPELVQILPDHCAVALGFIDHVVDPVGFRMQISVKGIRKMDPRQMIHVHPLCRISFLQPLRRQFVIKILYIPGKSGIPLCRCLQRSEIFRIHEEKAFQLVRHIVKCHQRIHLLRKFQVTSDPVPPMFHIGIFCAIRIQKITVIRIHAYLYAFLRQYVIQIGLPVGPPDIICISLLIQIRHAGQQIRQRTLGRRIHRRRILIIGKILKHLLIIPIIVLPEEQILHIFPVKGIQDKKDDVLLLPQSKQIPVCHHDLRPHRRIHNMFFIKGKTQRDQL